MKKTVMVSAFALASSATTALGFGTLLGSDTLAELTRAFTDPSNAAFCNGIRLNPMGMQQFFYGGGGSTNGEVEMRLVVPDSFTSGGNPALTRGQYIAPMSRAISGSRACDVNGGTTSAGIVVGLDALAIVRGGEGLPTPTTGCIEILSTGAQITVDALANGTAGFQVPANTTLDQTTGIYTFADWRDAIRLIFAGYHNVQGDSDLSNNSQSDRQDCNSDVRHALVANYANAFTCTSQAGCTELRHAWRRADLSGTTDTFLTLLGLPGITFRTLRQGDNVTAFCNGSQLQDRDPIRRPCVNTAGFPPAGVEQVCRGERGQGNLGLVLPIFVGEDLDIPVTTRYPTTACNGYRLTNLTAELTANPNILPPGVGPLGGAPLFRPDCPDASGDIFGFCDLPVVSPFVPGGYACLNDRPLSPSTLNASFSNLGFPTDARIHNLFTRDDATGAIVVSVAEGALSASYNRIHTTRTISTAPTARTCRELDATNAIGCLTQASPCSIGFAGQNAFVQQANVEGAFIDSVQPTEDNVRRALGFLTGTPQYPFARKLFYNTLNGWDSAAGALDVTRIQDPDQRALAQCALSLCSLNKAIDFAGFIRAVQSPACCTQPLPGAAICSVNSDCNTAVGEECIGGFCVGEFGSCTTQDDVTVEDFNEVTACASRATGDATDADCTDEWINTSPTCNFAAGETYGPTNFNSDRNPVAPATCACRPAPSDVILQTR